MIRYCALNFIRYFIFHFLLDSLLILVQDLSKRMLYSTKCNARRRNKDKGPDNRGFRSNILRQIKAIYKPILSTIRKSNSVVPMVNLDELKEQRICLALQYAQYGTFSLIILSWFAAIITVVITILLDSWPKYLDSESLINVPEIKYEPSLHCSHDYLEKLAERYSTSILVVS